MGDEGKNNCYSLQRTLENYQALLAQHAQDEVAPWISLFKYKVAAFSAYWRKQVEMPPCPYFGDKACELLHGRASRWVSSLCRKDPTKLRSLISSISAGLKGGLPRPGADYVDSKVISTVKKLFVDLPERPKPVSLPLFDLFFEEIKADTDRCQAEPIAFIPISPYGGRVSSKRLSLTRTISVPDLLGEVRRTVREVFGSKKMEEEDIYRMFFPSTSANYNNSRGDGGAVSSILEEVEIMEVVRIAVEKKLIPESDGDVRLELLTRRVWCEIKDEWKDEEYINFDDHRLRAKFLVLYHKVYEMARGEYTLVEPVGLAEALKARVITKCPPLLNFVLKPIQKWIHDLMRKLPTFKLLGLPASSKVVSEVIGKLMTNCNFISGDYMDATNCLRPEFSDEVITCLCDGPLSGLDEGYRTLLHRSLTGHCMDEEDIKLLIPDVKFPEDCPLTDGQKLRPQLFGQLMGSIMSFPVLCIINAALCRFSIELGFGKSLSLKQSHLLVNGDDCAFQGNLTVYKIWSFITPYAGLKPSLGKCFVSEEFVQINSRDYSQLITPVKYVKKIRVPSERDAFGYFFDDLSNVYALDYFEATPFIMMGLLTGLKRSQTIEIPDGHCGQKIGLQSFESRLLDMGPGSVGSRIRDVIETCPEYCRAEVWKKFSNKFRFVLDKAGLNEIPWYLPEALGGFGLPVPKDRKDDLKVDHGLTYMDWCIGKFISERSDSECKYYPRQVNQESDWRINAIIQEKLDCLPKLLTDDEFKVSNYRAFYASLCMWTLLNCPLNVLKYASLRPRENKEFHDHSLFNRLRLNNIAFSRLNRCPKIFKGTQSDYRNFDISSWKNFREIVDLEVNGVELDSVLSEDLVSYLRNTTVVLCFKR